MGVRWMSMILALNFKKNNMKDEIISFETAKILHKKKIFDYEYKSWYTPRGELMESSTRGIDFNFSGGLPAPSQSLLQKVLREKFHIDIMIEPFFDGDEEGGSLYEPTIFWDGFDEDENDDRIFPTYEEALESALTDALNIIK